MRAIGASNYSAPRLERGARDRATSSACRATNRCSRSTTWSSAPPYEDELEPVCVEHGLGVINFYALASGFLTGKYRSERRPRQERARRRREEVPERARPGGPRRARRGRRHGRRDAGQVALAWQIARPSITAPIASATHAGAARRARRRGALRLDTPSIELIDRVSRASRHDAHAARRPSRCR